MTPESFDELLKRDEQRAKDGFSKKIKIRKILAGPGKVIAVPHVEEEKLIHGDFEPSGEHGQGEAGHGEGEVGEVIGEIPLKEAVGGSGGEGEDENNGAGQGEGDHGIETEAYQLGKELTEKLQLPNLKDKGKKVPTDEYVFDLTDRHRRAGQLLDKKETLESVVESNVILGRVDRKNIDTSKLIVSPRDKVYRILSRERVWKSQAVVFFLRDYSGSMDGDPTKAVITQHLMIYSWLLFQYEKLVIPRFIVHDTEAKEVSVEEYFKLKTNGGTRIPSGYRKISEIVASEGLARDYNVYVFQGTDGDDWDDGKEAIPEIEKILEYANRMGVTVLRNSYNRNSETAFEQYIKKGKFEDRKEIFRMYVMSSENVSDEDNGKAVKALVAQD